MSKTGLESQNHSVLDINLIGISLSFPNLTIQNSKITKLER
jgi:hypothetical protein